MTGVTIRKATRSDAAAVMRLIRALAEYEGMGTSVLATESSLARDGFSDDALFQALLAEQSGEAVGFASYMIAYSIWSGAHFLQLDDVYVDQRCRGSGIGVQLMQAIARVCLTQDLAYARWTVETDNDAAIRFYRRLGSEVHNRGVCTWMPSMMQPEIAND